MAKGLGGMSKMGHEFPGKGEAKTSAPRDTTESMNGNGEGGEKHTSIIHHADGTHTMEHEGETTHHPEHKHLVTHLAHHLTDGDAHHLIHDDGMEEHHHSVDEMGEHKDGEPDGDEGVGEEEPEEEHETYGGM